MVCKRQLQNIYRSLAGTLSNLVNTAISRKFHLGRKSLSNSVSLLNRQSTKNKTKERWKYLQNIYCTAFNQHTNVVESLFFTLYTCTYLKRYTYFPHRYNIIFNNPRLTLTGILLIGNILQHEWAYILLMQGFFGFSNRGFVYYSMYCTTR